MKCQQASQRYTVLRLIECATTVTISELFYRINVDHSLTVKQTTYIKGGLKYI